MPAAWPNDQSGNPQPMALLTQDGNMNLETTVLCGLLASCDIPYKAMPSSDNGFGKVLMGSSWDSRFGYRVFVPESRLEEAKELLSAPILFEEDGSAQT